jgi:hypothetical protein
LESITHKTELKKIADDLADQFVTSDKAVAYIHKSVLKKKVKFPLLEYFTCLLFEFIPKKDRIKFLDQITALDEIGSYTIAGKFLQLMYDEQSTAQSFRKAEEYVIKADKWYACDIIGERVFGHALLTNPAKTLPHLKKLASHKDKWMVRTIGVATHYAVKKGLTKTYTEKVFVDLLALSNNTDFHTKKGIGWAAKTTAKFYPDLIKKYHKHIYDNSEVKQWFKTKIKIGLGRAWKYAGRK